MYPPSLRLFTEGRSTSWVEFLSVVMRVSGEVCICCDCRLKFAERVYDFYFCHSFFPSGVDSYYTDRNLPTINEKTTAGRVEVKSTDTVKSTCLEGTQDFLKTYQHNCLGAQV